MRKEESRALIIGIVVMLFLIVIPSCSENNRTGKDGYRFETKEYEKTSVEIEFVIIPNQLEFNQLAEIYVPEFIGHETAHCIWGQFHPNQ